MMDKVIIIERTNGSVQIQAGVQARAVNVQIGHQPQNVQLTIAAGVRTSRINASQASQVVVHIARAGQPGAKGEKGDPGSGVITYAAQNKDSVVIQPGAPVTQHASGSGVMLASAAQISTFCVGFAATAISPGFAGSILTDGLLTLSDWTPLTGAVNLQAKAKYYLDPVVGRITASAPSTQGQIVQFIGIAIDTSTLEIRISQTILL